MPSREEGLALLKEFNSDESLIRHALAVEAVMRHCARKLGQDEEKWGLVGLMHDLDYQRYPNEHCRKTQEILKERGWPEEIARAAVSHGFGICTDVEPQSAMEKTLYAVDELTGLITACAYVRPSKSVKDMEVSSVRKKWKQRGFAAGVNREVIRKGADMLGLELAVLIQDAIDGLRTLEWA